MPVRPEKLKLFLDLAGGDHFLKVLSLVENDVLLEVLQRHDIHDNAL